MPKMFRNSNARALVSKDEDEPLRSPKLRDASQPFELVGACVPCAAMLLSMRANCSSGTV
jgi:hypothetical protein